MPDPETATPADVEVERINVARAYVDCRQRHGDLVTFVKGGPSAPKAGPSAPLRASKP